MRKFDKIYSTKYMNIYSYIIGDNLNSIYNIMYKNSGDKRYYRLYNRKAYGFNIELKVKW